MEYGGSGNRECISAWIETCSHVPPMPGPIFGRGLTSWNISHFGIRRGWHFTSTGEWENDLLLYTAWADLGGIPTHQPWIGKRSQINCTVRLSFVKGYSITRSCSNSVVDWIYRLADIKVILKSISEHTLGNMADKVIPNNTVFVTNMATYCLCYIQKQVGVRPHVSCSQLTAHMSLRIAFRNEVSRGEWGGVPKRRVIERVILNLNAQVASLERGMVEGY